MKASTMRTERTAQTSQHSLPLFGDDQPRAESAKPASGQCRRVSPRPPVDRHLSAARRLAREIRRTAPGSPEQVMTGRRICRHLIAMLQGAPAGSAPRR